MKYKLIQLLPFENSPQLGYISESHFPDTTKNSKCSHYWCGNWFEPKNYPEFWELVVEKDYEILSVITTKASLIKDNILTLNEYKKRCPSSQVPNECINIHSVKRLADGKIFTIGDLVDSIENIGRCINSRGFWFDNKFIGTKSKIKSFQFIGDILTIYTNYNNFAYTINSFEKSKQTLFTTEDGVDIFENDNIYWINISTFEKVNCNKYNDDLGEISIKSLLSKKYKCKAISFSTKEKAEEFILLNKPVLSYGEIQEYLKIKDCNKVLDLAQSKIQQSV